MFTGIIEEQGIVRSLLREPAGCRIVIEPERMAGELAVGESVAINGCCLTAVRCTSMACEFQAGPETLQKTNLGELQGGARVNLERAMPADGRFGGHLVQGHVDGVGNIRSRQRDDEWETVWFSAGSLTAQMVPKGSVAVDGVSLTVVDVTAEAFSVALIPHTLAVTTLGQKPIGASVNLETDVLAKYVVKYLERLEMGITVEKLKTAGFMP